MNRSVPNPKLESRCSSQAGRLGLQCKLCSSRALAQTLRLLQSSLPHPCLNLNLSLDLSSLPCLGSFQWAQLTDFFPLLNSQAGTCSVLLLINHAPANDSSSSLGFLLPTSSQQMEGQWSAPHGKCPHHHPCPYPRAAQAWFSLQILALDCLSPAWLLQQPQINWSPSVHCILKLSHFFPKMYILGSHKHALPPQGLL